MSISPPSLTAIRRPAAEVLVHGQYTQAQKIDDLKWIGHFLVAIDNSARAEWMASRDLAEPWPTGYPLHYCEKLFALIERVSPHLEYPELIWGLLPISCGPLSRLAYRASRGESVNTRGNIGVKISDILPFIQIINSRDNIEIAKLLK